MNIDPNDPRLQPGHVVMKGDVAVSIKAGIWHVVCVRTTPPYLVEYWARETGTPISHNSHNWHELATFDNKADAVTAFWNTYQLKLWSTRND